MKSIVECLSERLLNESREQVIVFFDHGDPDRTIIYQGTNPKAVKLIMDSAYDYEIVQASGNVLFIKHSDEWGFVIPYQNEAKFKSEQINCIKQSIKGVELTDDADDMYLEIETEFTGYSIEGKEAANVLKMNDAQLYKKFVIDAIENSEIDGDSSSGMALVDIKAKKELVQGGMSITFYDDKDVIGMFYDED